MNAVFSCLTCLAAELPRYQVRQLTLDGQTENFKSRGEKERVSHHPVSIRGKPSVAFLYFDEMKTLAADLMDLDNFSYFIYRMF